MSEMGSVYVAVDANEADVAVMAMGSSGGTSGSGTIISWTRTDTGDGGVNGGLTAETTWAAVSEGSVARGGPSIPDNPSDELLDSAVSYWARHYSGEYLVDTLACAVWA